MICGAVSVMNVLPLTHCTSPMDYISHHALHSHIPVHHYTIHSLVLIVSPHLHLIHSHTFKQHSHMHSLRSLVLPWLTFWAFPLFSPGLTIYFWPFAACILTLPAFKYPLCLPPAPDLCIGPVVDSALPSLLLLLPLTIACLTTSCLSIKLQLDLTTLPLHYRRLRHLRSSGFPTPSRTFGFLFWGNSGSHSLKGGSCHESRPGATPSHHQRSPFPFLLN